MDCDQPGQSLRGLVVRPGFYRFKTSSREVYDCDSGGNCVGGNLTGDALCSASSFGPLCTQCREDYFKNQATKSCEVCRLESSDEYYSGPFLGILIAFCATVLFLKKYKLKIRRFKKDRFKEIRDFKKAVASTVTTLQIVLLVDASHRAVGG